MPDGDIVHKGLAPRYQASYKQMCEGQLPDEAVGSGAQRFARRAERHPGLWQRAVKTPRSGV